MQEIKIIVSPLRGLIKVLVIDGKIYGESLKYVINEETGELITDEILVDEGNFANCIKPVYCHESNDFIEGANLEELNAIEQRKLNELLMPSDQEIEQAEFEIKTIELLTDLGVL